MTFELLRTPRRRRVLFLLLLGLPSILSFAKSKDRLQKTTLYGTGVWAGTYTSQYDHTCIVFNEFFISANFFVGLKAMKEPTGVRKFMRDGEVYSEFPEDLVVDVEANVVPCPIRPDRAIPPDYASGLMEDASFEAHWQSSDELRPATVLSTKIEHHSPGLKWDYFLRLRPNGVPLTDKLIIYVSLRRGISRSRLSASLLPAGDARRR